MVRITTTHSSNSLHSPMARPPLKARPLHPQQALRLVVRLTRTPFMVATRIIWRCGTHRSPNSSSKEVHHPVHQVLRLHSVRDHVHDAETAAERCRLTLACLHDRCLDYALRGMIIPDFLDFFSTLFYLLCGPCSRCNRR